MKLFWIFCFLLGNLSGTNQAGKPWTSKDSATLFVSNWKKAWSQGPQTVDAIVDFFSTEAFLFDPAFPKGVSGKKNIKDSLMKIATENQPSQHQILNIHLTDSGILVRWVGDIRRSGKVGHEVRGVDYFEFDKAGKILRLDTYFDASSLK